MLNPYPLKLGGLGVNMNRRHQSRTALICFLLCIPLAFIAYFAVIYATKNISADEVTSVEVSLPDGSAITYTDPESIAYYVNIFLRANELSSPLRDPEESTSVTVKCARDGRELVYKIYPELSLTGCMFTDPQGKYFLITADDAKSLLSRDEFSYLYSSVCLPSMFVVTGSLRTEVSPSSYEWQYEKLDGSYTDYTGKATTTQTQEYSIYSDRVNSMSFTREPDDVTVTMTDEDGNLLGQTDFSSLIFGNDTQIRVTVEASWDQTGESECHGTASYSFNVIYDIPAVVSFSSEEAEIGGYVIVNVKYLNDSESVILDSTLKTSELHFTENEGIKTAVLGISDDNIPGTYDVIYNIGDNHGTIQLTITGTPRDEREDIYRLDISSQDYETKLGETAEEDFDDTLNDIYAKLGTKTYSSIENFASPTEDGTLSQGYGVRIITNIDNTTDTKLFYSIGNSYDMVENAKVMAAANGIVIYTGKSETLGNFVVVDHGCGVCTWYYGLSSIGRDVGTEVQKGDIIGFAGISGYTGQSSLGFCVTAGKVFIKPAVS